MKTVRCVREAPSAVASSDPTVALGYPSSGKTSSRPGSVLVQKSGHVDDDVQISALDPFHEKVARKSRYIGEVLERYRREDAGDLPKILMDEKSWKTWKCNQKIVMKAAQQLQADDVATKPTGSPPTKKAKKGKHPEGSRVHTPLSATGEREIIPGAIGLRNCNDLGIDTKLKSNVEINSVFFASNVSVSRQCCSSRMSRFTKEEYCRGMFRQGDQRACRRNVIVAKRPSPDEV